MNLLELRIVTSAHTYSWRQGEPLDNLQEGVTELQNYIDQHKTPVAIATEQLPDINAS